MSLPGTFNRLFLLIFLYIVFISFINARVVSDFILISIINVLFINESAFHSLLTDSTV